MKRIKIVFIKIYIFILLSFNWNVYSMVQEKEEVLSLKQLTANSIAKKLLNMPTLKAYSEIEQIRKKLPAECYALLSMIGKIKDLKDPLNWQLWETDVDYREDCLLRFKKKLVVIDDKELRIFADKTMQLIAKHPLQTHIFSIDDEGKRVLYLNSIYNTDPYQKVSDEKEWSQWRKKWVSNCGNYKIIEDDEPLSLKIYQLDTNQLISEVPLHQFYNSKEDKIHGTIKCDFKDNILAMIVYNKRERRQLLIYDITSKTIKFKYRLAFHSRQGQILFDRNILGIYCDWAGKNAEGLIWHAHRDYEFDEGTETTVPGKMIRKIIMNPHTGNIVVANESDRSITFLNKKNEELFSFETTKNHCQTPCQMGCSTEEPMWVYEIDRKIKLFPLWDTFTLPQILYLNALDFVLYDMYQWKNIDINTLKDEIVITTFPEIMQTNIRQRLECIENHVQLAVNSDIKLRQSIIEDLRKKFEQKDFLPFINKFRLIQNCEFFSHIIRGIAKKLIEKRKFFSVQKNKVRSENIYNYYSKNISQSPDIIDRIYSNSYSKVKKVKPKPIVTQDHHKGFFTNFLYNVRHLMQPCSQFLKK